MSVATSRGGPDGGALKAYWREHSLIRRAIGLWRFGLTPAGKGLTLGGLALASAGSGSIAMPMYHVASALGGIWLAGLAAGSLFRARTRMQVSMPRHATAGQPAEVQVAAEPAGRRRLLGVHYGVRVAGTDSGAEAFMADAIEPGERARGTVSFTPARRGLFGPVDVRCWSQFPFGLFRVPLAAERFPLLTVYPAFSPIAGLDVPMGRRFQPGGIALTSATGESPEYIGNREYRPGDAVRRIDFRAWARLGKPAVREYQEEYFCRVALVLDTYLPRGARIPPEGHSQLEAAISLSAAVADCLARGEYIIDLFAAGPELYVFRAGRSIAHFDNILEILAGIDPCRRNPFATLQPALVEELGHITTVICVMLDWDQTRNDLARTALEAGCAVKAVVVRDDDPTLPPLDDAIEMVHVRPGDVFAGQVDAL